MLKFNSLFLVILAALMFSSCLNKVPAGYVGVKVNLLGGEKGVDTEELPVGRHWIGVNEELHLFPVFKQNYVWTQDPQEGSPNDESISFQTGDGMNIGMDIGITYSLNPSKINSIFQKYRKGVVEITDLFLRNRVRDAAVRIGGSMDVEDFIKDKSGFIEKIQTMVSSKLESEGILVEKIYLIGMPRLPKAIEMSINDKLQANQLTQQRENEIKTSAAEADKKIEAARGEAQSKLAIAKAEADSILLKAKAQAEANMLISKSINRTLIEYEQVRSWNGQLPSVTGGVVPFFDINAKGTK